MMQVSHDTTQFWQLPWIRKIQYKILFDLASVESVDDRLSQFLLQTQQLGQ